jgi:hypothetical protein
MFVRARIRQRAPNRRVLTRIAAMLTALAAGSLVAVAVAAPAPASEVCSTGGQVDAIDPSSSGVFTKFETDPIDGPTYDFSMPIDTPVGLAIRGNGLNPTTAPYWDVFDQDGTFIRRVTGNLAGSDCVSNQKFFTDCGRPETVHVYRAVYQAGNSGATVNQQAHFRFIFDQPSPPPPPGPADEPAEPPPPECKLPTGTAPEDPSTQVP